MLQDVTEDVAVLFNALRVPLGHNHFPFADCNFVVTAFTGEAGHPIRGFNPHLDVPRVSARKASFIASVVLLDCVAAGIGLLGVRGRAVDLNS